MLLVYRPFIFKLFVRARFSVRVSRMDERKKPRSSNYTNTEKYDLCTIIAGFKSVIESKKTDSVTWTDKEAAWRTVASQFNALSPNGTFRSAESLKKCYENIKHTAKKQSADEKIELIKTGGGRANATVIDPVHEKALSIMNSKTVKGFPNLFDSDCLEIPVNDADDDFIVEMLPDVTDEEYSAVMKSLTKERNEPKIVDAHYTVHSECTADIYGDAAHQDNPSTSVDDSWKRYTPTDLKRPLNKKLAPQTTDGPSTKAKKPKLNIQTEKTTSKVDTSSPHPTTKTPQRRPGIIGLHSTDLAKEYSELAAIKLKVAEEQLKILQAEAQAAIIKREREDIEFNLRKKCLELDIEIKKRQAQRLKDVLD